MTMLKTRLVMLLLGFCVLSVYPEGNLREYSALIIKLLQEPTRPKPPIPLLATLVCCFSDAGAAKCFGFVSDFMHSVDEKSGNTVLQDRLQEELYRKNSQDAHALHMASYIKKSLFIAQVRRFEKLYKPLDPPFNCCAPNPLTRRIVEEPVQPEEEMKIVTRQLASRNRYNLRSSGPVDAECCIQ